LSLTYLIHFVYIGLLSKSSCEFLNLQLGSVYWQLPAPWKHISPPLASQVRCVVVAQVLLIADEFCAILLTIWFGNCFGCIWCPNAELWTLSTHWNTKMMKWCAKMLQNWEELVDCMESVISIILPSQSPISRWLQVMFFNTQYEPPKGLPGGHHWKIVFPFLWNRAESVVPGSRLWRASCFN
jgi:hypothetical protein